MNQNDYLNQNKYVQLTSCKQLLQLACATGTYSSEIGSLTCSKCSAGEFQSMKGQSECLGLWKEWEEKKKERNKEKKERKKKKNNKK